MSENGKSLLMQIDAILPKEIATHEPMLCQSDLGLKILKICYLDGVR